MVEGRFRHAIGKQYSNQSDTRKQTQQAFILSFPSEFPIGNVIYKGDCHWLQSKSVRD